MRCQGGGLFRLAQCLVAFGFERCDPVCLIPGTLQGFTETRNLRDCSVSLAFQPDNALVLSGSFCCSGREPFHFGSRLIPLDLKLLDPLRRIALSGIDLLGQSFDLRAGSVTFGRQFRLRRSQSCEFRLHLGRSRLSRFGLRADGLQGLLRLAQPRLRGREVAFRDLCRIDRGIAFLVRRIALLFQRGNLRFGRFHALRQRIALLSRVLQLPLKFRDPRLARFAGAGKFGFEFADPGREADPLLFQRSNALRLLSRVLFQSRR